MLSKSFKQFILQEEGKSLSSDGTDPNPTQTANAAQDIVQKFTTNPKFADDISRLNSIDPKSSKFNTGVNKLGMAAVKSQEGPPEQQGATAFDVSNLIKDRISTPNPNAPGKIFMRKKMKKRMKK